MTFDESFGEAWRARYGSEAPSELDDLSPFLRHRCIRKYTDEPVSEELIQGLVASAQSAGTSSHLQLWSLVSVHDPNKRRDLEEVSGYHHVATAPWLFVFLADIHRLQTNSDGGDALDFIEYYTMAVVDASLACERMVCAAESVGLGACYIGALRNDPERVAQVLRLPYGVFAVFGLCLGWPAERPEIKPRLAQRDVWFRDTYPETAGVAEFDQRMKSYYAKRGQDPNVTWSMRSGRRSDVAHLTGREILMEWLKSRGFLRR